MSAFADRLLAAVIGVLVGTSLVNDIGDLVTFFAGLGGAGAIVGRFIVDFLRRGDRDPERLAQLDRKGREQLADRVAYWQWWGTLLGALIGVLVAALVFALDQA